MWYESLSALDKVYFYLAIVASTILIVQLVLMLFSLGNGGDLDAGSGADFDGDGDIDGDGDFSDGGLSFFTVKGLVSAFTVGGWSGFATSVLVEGNEWISILVFLVTAVLTNVGFGFAMRGIMKLQCSGNLVMNALVGKEATTYVSIPPTRSGRGKVTLEAQGKFTELDALTEGERIATDTPVVITAVEGDCVVVVKKEYGFAQTSETESKE